MSIQLMTEKYCDNCPDFEADVNKITYVDGVGNDVADTLITCKKRSICKGMYDYLRKQEK